VNERKEAHPSHHDEAFQEQNEKGFGHHRNIISLGDIPFALHVSKASYRASGSGVIGYGSPGSFWFSGFRGILYIYASEEVL
jgi:hypothetical protein